jgi:hypothetical protein
VLLRTTQRGTDPDTVGRATARRLLDDEGGRALLELEHLEASRDAS